MSYNSQTSVLSFVALILSKFGHPYSIDFNSTNVTLYLLSISLSGILFWLSKNGKTFVEDYCEFISFTFEKPKEILYSIILKFCLQ